MNHRTALLALTGLLGLGAGACSDDADRPTDDTSSEVVPGGTALPGDPPSVDNTNVANPQAPQNPSASAPAGSAP